MIDTRYNTDGSVFSQTQTNWTYDNDDRLADETLTALQGGSNAPGPFSDLYAYDLENNRVSEVSVSGGATDTTTSSYNADGELKETVDTAAGTTSFTYDNAGNQIASTNQGVITTDGYDLRGRLISVTSGGKTTTYTHDTAGNLTSETTGGTTTFYLNDTLNPTGYAKPVEQWTSTTGSEADAVLSMSYTLGLNAVGQASGGSVEYFLTDGQDSTRALLNSTGVVTAEFNYDAFGNATGFDPATAGTIFLYGGDGVYDTPSGLYFHGSGRESENAYDRFMEMDAPGYASNANPISLNTYLLDGADAVNMRDPSGHLMEELAADLVEDYIFSWSAVTTIDAVRAIAASYSPVSPFSQNDGGEWLATAGGLSVGFGLGGAGGQLQLYHGLGSGDEVAGFNIAFSVNLPGTRTVASYLKDLSWYSNLLLGQLADPTLTVAATRDLVGACMRGWAAQAGGDLRMSLGFSASATMGGGMVFNAPQAQYLPGLFVGVQGAAEGNFEGVSAGVSADALWGFSLHDDQFTGAYETDIGTSMGFGTNMNSMGAGLQISGTFFIPTNMPGWTKVI